MKPYKLLIIILAIPATFAGILSIFESPAIAPLVGITTLEITLSIGLFFVIITGCIGLGFLINLINNRSKSEESWVPNEVIRILVDLRKKYGEGFDTDDARVVEAFQKGKEDLEDIAIFTDMSEKKVQKIMDKLANKGVNGFEF